MSSEMEYSAGESSLDSVTTRSQNMLSLRSRNVKRGKDGAKSEGNKTRNKHQPQQGKGKVVVNAARREMRRRRNLAKQKSRNISAERLKEAADMLQDPDHRIWKVPKSCNASIHRYYQKNNNSHIADHLRCLRQCLLRKDWRNLCRLLSIIPADPRYDFYYPVFFKVRQRHSSVLVSQFVESKNTPSFLSIVCNNLLGSHQFGAFE